MAQFSTVPSGFFTSTCIQVWGFTHSILVMVPLKLTGLLASNSAAKAWCADTDVAPPQTARPAMMTTVANFVRIDFSLLPRVKQEGRHGPRRLEYPDQDMWRPLLLLTTTVPLIKTVTGGHFAGDIDDDGVTLPVLHQLFLA